MYLAEFSYLKEETVRQPQVLSKAPTFLTFQKWIHHSVHFPFRMLRGSDVARPLSYKTKTT